MYTCLHIAKTHGGHVIQFVCEVKSRTEVNTLGTKAERVIEENAVTMCDGRPGLATLTALGGARRIPD